jgi:hypothetical protein
VGEVQLAYVTEVSVPLDENNNEIAPDPEVPTPTADIANVRLILHVNGAGQASLLKDVALLRRARGTNSLLASEHDMALVTDERLYGEFPPQPATRIASALFDFGDSRATEAVDAIVEAVARAVTSEVASATSFDTLAERKAVQDAAQADAEAAAQPVAENADIAEAFSSYLTTYLSPAIVETIAEAADPATAPETLTAYTEATNLMENSFYGDERALELMDDLLEAIDAAGAEAIDRVHAADGIVSSYADVEDQYHRFIAGEAFGDMIESAADTAGSVATNPVATEPVIRAAVDADGDVATARTTALQIKSAPYNDWRGTNAIAIVLDAIVGSAAGEIGGDEETIAGNAEAAGYAALSAAVPRFPVSGYNPTLEYNDFVQADSFATGYIAAAEAAAEGAVSERHNNSLYTTESLYLAAKAAVVNALYDTYAAAARTIRPSIPLSGTFGPGEGDPRFLWDISQTNAAPLGAAALEGEVYLPAHHPTNPFRHRRHPSHTRGFDIIRHIRIDFDDVGTNGLNRVGYGVDQLSGVYREEVDGLHKPLGPDKDIGLKTEGPFELNRISFIDALNAL